MSRVPEGWSVGTLKEYCTAQGGYAFKTSDFQSDGIPVVKISNIKSGRVVIGEDAPCIDDVIISDKFNRFLLNTGDVLMALSGATTGKLGVYWGESLALLNQRVARFIAIAGNSKEFLPYILERISVDVARLAYGAAQPNISTKELENWIVPLIPLPEQKRIAAILSSVDDAIAATEAVIEQTQRVKEGLLQDLLTRGIGHTRFKQTEIGEIPEGWEVKTISECCDLVADCKNRTPVMTPTGFPVLKTFNIRDGKLLHDNLTYTDEASYEVWTQRGVPQEGDLIITREAPLGEACLIPKGLQPCMGQRMMLFRADLSVALPSFLLSVILSPQAQKRFLLLAGGSTVGHIRVGDMKNFLVPVPPLDEQRKITAVIEGLVDAHSFNKLEQLQQTKRGLMQDLLSGDVRVAV